MVAIEECAEGCGASGQAEARAPPRYPTALPSPATVHLLQITADVHPSVIIPTEERPLLSSPFSYQLYLVVFSVIFVFEQKNPFFTSHFNIFCRG